MDDPRLLHLREGIVPLRETGFFAEMDLLPFANEGDHQGPRVHPLGKPEEIFRLACCMAPLLIYPLSVPGSLSLIIHPDMFVRDLGCRAAILFQKSVNILDKDLVLQGMPGNFHERAVAGEEDRVIPESGDIARLPALCCLTGVRNGLRGITCVNASGADPAEHTAGL